jgi:acetyl-CoA carboxylase carboxyltransferase component
MRVAHAFAWATTPMVSVVVRKAFGMGAVAMCGHGSGQVLTLVWPSGDFGAMPLEGGIQAGHRTAGEDIGPEHDALRAAYEEGGDPFDVASSFNFDDLIDPRDTRQRIARWLDAALATAGPPVQPAARGGIMP